MDEWKLVPGMRDMRTGLPMKELLAARLAGLREAAEILKGLEEECEPDDHEEQIMGWALRDGIYKIRARISELEKE